MKFYARYPTCKPGTEPEPGILRVSTPEPCCICRELTSFLDIDFEGGICSDECDTQIWHDYLEASRDKTPEEIAEQEQNTVTATKEASLGNQVEETLIYKENMVVSCDICLRTMMRARMEFSGYIRVAEDTKWIDICYECFPQLG